jgi:hypothetical protein
MFGGFVFQDIRQLTPSAVTQATKAQRLKRHLVLHSLDDNEILHGFRAGGALAMALEGRSLTEIMAPGLGFWVGGGWVLAPQQICPGGGRSALDGSRVPIEACCWLPITKI